MAAPRLCPHCGKPTIGRHVRCHSQHYGPAHQAERARWAPEVAAGTVRCWHCSELIAPDTDWHLAHHDDGTPSTPAHAACNVRATRSM